MRTAPAPMPLSALSEGAACKISAIQLDGILRRRVFDLGIIPGTTVECVRKSPTGDPIAYRVRDTVIALRGEDAGRIQVFMA